MAQFIKNYVQDLAQDIQIRHCGTLIFNTDEDSNVINVALYNGQEEAPQSGSVACAVICSDGSTVPVTGGTISGNTVSVTLGAAGMIPGQVGIGIQVISGDVKTTVFKAVYSVELFETDTVVDPSSRITISVGELVSDIEAAVASIPADYSDLLAAIAPTFSSSTAYAAGTYAWYSGTLYRFTVDHAAGSWTGSDAVAVVIGAELATLKSAFMLYDSGYKTFNVSWEVGNIGLDANEPLGIKWDTTVKYRVSCLQPITLKQKQNIYVKSGYRFILFRNNGSNKYTSTTSWITADYEVPNDTDCYMVLAKNPDVTGTTADVYEFVSAITIKTDFELRTEKISDDLAVVSGNTKNLIDSFKGTVSSCGLTINCDGNCGYSISGTPTSQGGRTTPLTNIITLAAGTYTLSSTLGAGIHNREIYVNKKSDNSVIANANINSSSVTFTLASETEVYIGMAVYTSSTYLNTYDGLKFGLQLETGSVQTAFVPHRTAFDYIARNYGKAEELVFFQKNGNNLSIITNFGDGKTKLSAFVTQSDVNNPAFDFGEYSGSFVKTSDDDICPIYYNGSYRCAGHGNLVAFNLTSESHGLTETDIGKVYTLNNVSWVLMKVPDANHVWVVSEITNEPTRPFVTTIADSGTLANAGGNIVYTAKTATQIRPNNIKRQYSMYVDNEPITKDGMYYGRKVILTESYQSLDCVNMVAVLKANVGSNTNASYYADSIGGDLEYSVAYIFSPDSSCCVSETITVLRDNIDLSFIGLTQAQTYSTTGYVPFTVYDTPASISEAWNFTSSNWRDANFPPYKYYQLDLTNQKGFAVGYDITIGQGLPDNRKNNIADGGNFNGSSRKMYPKFYGKGFVATKGFKVSGNAFRCPILPNSFGFGYSWQTLDSIFVELEAFSAGTISVDLPTYAVGKTLTVVKGSDNLIISDGIVSNNKMKVVASGAGSATLKIN